MTIKQILYRKIHSIFPNTSYKKVTHVHAMIKVLFRLHLYILAAPKDDMTVEYGQ